MKNGKAFELYLDQNWFEKGEILNSGYQQVKVLNTPKTNRTNILWRVLRFISFKKLGKQSIYYKVKPI